jgi:hypothetical protein
MRIIPDTVETIGGYLMTRQGDFCNHLTIHDTTEITDAELDDIIHEWGERMLAKTNYTP